MIQVILDPALWRIAAIPKIGTVFCASSEHPHG